MYTIKRGDTRTALQATLYENDAPVDLTTATSVRFFMRLAGSSMNKIDGGNVVLADAANGVVWYVWNASDVDTRGDYRGEFRVTFADGRTATFPSEGYIEIRIARNLS